MQGDIDLNPFRRRLRKHGQAADAQVLSITTPKWQSASGGLTLVHDYMLAVRPAGSDQFEAKVRDSFNITCAPRVGDVLKVKFNPRSHKVAFDLDGDPRYDVLAGTVS